MKHSIVVIMGCSRSYGNTRKVIRHLMVMDPTIDYIDLNAFKFSYFDYQFRNADDDFIFLIHKVLMYDTIVFATPIYWYTMSAQLKTFFDRLSDLLYEDKKNVGRQFRGKNMAVLSCGADDELFEGFTMPFIQTANYLGMHYKGHLHTYIDNDSTVSNKINTDMNLFLQKLKD